VQDFNQATRDLLAVAMRVSPTGKEQEAFTKLHNLMSDNGLTPREIFLGLLGAIQDGVRFGNWVNPQHIS
jgi:hypothetical protein